MDANTRYDAATVNARAKVLAFIEPGSEIVGNVAGTAIGLISAGAAGALAGAAAGPAIAAVIERTCLDIYDRVSGQRERVRGGAAAAIALTTIAERIKDGEPIRQDGFFDSTTARSAADEILEGVVMRSRTEHEERKVRYYGNLFASAAFDARFSPCALNFFLGLATRLTYRQFCLLELFATPPPLQLRDSSYDGARQLPIETIGVLAEAFELYQLNLIHCQQPGHAQGTALLSLSDIHPRCMDRTGLGEQLHILLGLQRLPRPDVESAGRWLR